MTSREALEIVEIKPGLKFGKGILKDLLPDIETALFFAKVYELDAAQVSNLLLEVFKTPLVQALVGEGGHHSVQLQDYVVDLTTQIPGVTKGDLAFSNKVVPKGEILPEMWKQLELDVAQSIKDVAAKLKNVVGLLPGKKGNMVFKSMSVMNRRRPTIGDHKAQIHHAPVKENLIIMDVSGSMNSNTVATIVDDVVALSYMANAHMAIVSDSTTHWEPGTYGVDEVLRHATYGGTHYETLRDLMQRDWGVVVCIADYDSSASSAAVIAAAGGHIDECIDISLVNRPTFLAEVVGQLADRVRPLLVAAPQNYYPLS